METSEEITRASSSGPASTSLTPSDLSRLGIKPVESSSSSDTTAPDGASGGYVNDSADAPWDETTGDYSQSATTSEAGFQPTRDIYRDTPYKIREQVSKTAGFLREIGLNPKDYPAEMTRDELLGLERSIDSGFLQSQTNPVCDTPIYGFTSGHPSYKVAQANHEAGLGALPQRGRLGEKRVLRDITAEMVSGGYRRGPHLPLVQDLNEPGQF
jgi:hypothetical protein